MWLLYADESGSLNDPNQDLFVLAGIAVFERKTHWIEQLLIEISKRFNEHDPFAIELHGSPMRGGRDIWRSFPPAQRLQAAKDALALCADPQNQIKLFASVTSKAKASGKDILEHSFTQLASRFDHFLARQYRKYNNPQRGIIILDKSSTELQIQRMARAFKFEGHAWGRLRNMAEVPLFIDSKASKLMQLADLVAFAIKRHFANKDSELYKIIENSFDHEGGVRHGLHLWGIED